MYIFSGSAIIQCLIFLPLSLSEFILLVGFFCYCEKMLVNIIHNVSILWAGACLVCIMCVMSSKKVRGPGLAAKHDKTCIFFVCFGLCFVFVCFFVSFFLGGGGGG